MKSPGPASATYSRWSPQRIRARPDLLGPDAGQVDRGRAVHARGLRGVRVELIPRNDLDAVGLPIDVLVPVVAAHLDHPARSHLVLIWLLIAKKEFPMKLAVPDLISNSYFPAVAAVELGFFKEEGLDVSLELVFPVDRA